ncbi:unnamed protein product, partial [Ectocarpus fasciculatus]
RLPAPSCLAPCPVSLPLVPPCCSHFSSDPTPGTGFFLLFSLASSAAVAATTAEITASRTPAGMASLDRSSPGNTTIAAARSSSPVSLFSLLVAPPPPPPPPPPSGTKSPDQPPKVYLTTASATN